jgi:hypothetical protein
MRIALALAALIALPAAANPASSVARLSWLTGSWSETKGDVTTRETWEALDGALVGTGETLRAGKRTSGEQMKITAEAAGATFSAVVSPGQPPTPFVLLPGREGEAVFENKAHDFPSASSTGAAAPSCARGSRGRRAASSVPGVALHAVK